jgi:hypothetical protein
MPYVSIASCMLYVNKDDATWYFENHMDTAESQCVVAT